MKKNFLFIPAALLLLGLLACSDEDSGFDPFNADEFQCKVTSGSGWVKQEIVEPAVGRSVAKVQESGDHMKIFMDEDLYGLSLEKVYEKCDSLRLNSFIYDNGSFVCEGSHIGYSMTVSREGANSLSEIKREMQEDCDKYEKNNGRISSSSNESSSSVTSSSRESSSSYFSAYSSSRPYSSSYYSSSSYSSASSSSSDGSKYVYTYKGRGQYYDTGWAVYIKSNCADSVCFEDFETFEFFSATVMTHTEGVDGGEALLLPGDQYLVLPWDMNKSIAEGSLDFYYKPDDDFVESGSYALVGNDGARMNVFYRQGRLYFYKNLANIFVTVSAPASLKKGEWNRITAEWSTESGLIAIFLDGKQLASQATEYPYYSPSDRGRNDNVVMVGYKSNCCLGNLNSEYFGAGAFDNIKVVGENIFAITEMTSSSSAEVSSSSAVPASSAAMSSDAETPASSDSVEPSNSSEVELSSASAED